MPKVTTVEDTVIKTVNKIELDADDLRLMMVKHHKVPKGAVVRIYFQVPGGGDWSGEVVDISSHSPLTVEWETKVETTRKLPEED